VGLYFEPYNPKLEPYNPKQFEPEDAGIVCRSFDKPYETTTESTTEPTNIAANKAQEFRCHEDHYADLSSEGNPFSTTFWPVALVGVSTLRMLWTHVLSPIEWWLRLFGFGLSSHSGGALFSHGSFCGGIIGEVNSLPPLDRRTLCSLLAIVSAIPFLACSGSFLVVRAPQD
jgi:hypothetical protein